jgi:polar amino acid transport system permease protein
MQYSFYFAPVLSRVGELLQGTVNTLWLSALVGLLGFIVGILGAIAQRSRSQLLRRCVVGYVEAIRNTPLLAQLFFFYFGLAGLGLKLDALTAAIIAYLVNLGAYATEIVRAGIDAIPRSDRGRKSARPSPLADLLLRRVQAGDQGDVSRPRQPVHAAGAGDKPGEPDRRP